MACHTPNLYAIATRERDPRVSNAMPKKNNYKLELSQEAEQTIKHRKDDDAFSVAMVDFYERMRENAEYEVEHTLREGGLQLQDLGSNSYVCMLCVTCTCDGSCASKERVKVQLDTHQYVCKILSLYEDQSS